ncbi:hypothetical protein BGZ93_008686 [Podila epicladia]|nr:hypothetical protein BGZ93_008686 [Podila epicladia]
MILQYTHAFSTYYTEASEGDPIKPRLLEKQLPNGESVAPSLLLSLLVMRDCYWEFVAEDNGRISTDKSLQFDGRISDGIGY